MIVVDASAVIALLMRTRFALQIEARLLAPSETLHAPHLIDAEVAHALRRLDTARTISGDRGMASLELLDAMPIQRYPHGLLLPRVWQLRHNLTAYDALYVALAELLDAPLLTCDRRLATAPLHHARIETVS